MNRHTITCAVLLLAGASMISCSNSEYEYFSPMGEGGKGEMSDQSPQTLDTFVNNIRACAADLQSEGAADCFKKANENPAIMSRIEAGLAETRDIMKEMYRDENLVKDLVPSAEKAAAELSLLTRTAMAACERTTVTNKPRCQVAAQAGQSYLYARWVVDYSKAFYKEIDRAVPQSERLAACQAAYDVEMEKGPPQMQMNMIAAEFGDCAAEANDAFVLARAEAMSDASQQTKAKESLNSLRDAAARVCSVLVNASDSATGSISRLYLIECNSDVERFLAVALDWIMQAG